MILGLLAASKSNNYNAANAAIMGSQAIAIQNGLNYSRDMEREADRTGFGVATEAGFEAQGFVAMFEKLQQASRNNDSGGFPYLRSHPLTTERITDMQGRIGMQPASQLAADADWQALLMAARARVLSNSGVDALRLWQADVQPEALVSKSPAQRAAALYGAALAAIRMRALESAKALVNQLAAVAGAPPLVERLVRLLRADIALATEDFAGAANALAAPVRPALPDDMVLDRAELLLRAQVQTTSGQAGLAATDLYRWVMAHPRDFNAWRSLGQAYEVQGRAIAAIRAQAQADGLQQDWSAALARLRAAQDLVRKGQWGSQGPDYIEATIVDTRAREIVQMMREQAAQQR
jgi:predicted Zn-dependent protease